MREIKFRFWSDLKGWVSHNYLLDSEGRVYDIGLVVDDQVEVMQYTGLKDKNGTEIYEGDIVKAYHREWEEYTTSHVKFCDGAFSLGRYWKDGIHSWYSMEQYESSELQVVGNIYQNPELLEDSDER